MCLNATSMLLFLWEKVALASVGLLLAGGCLLEFLLALYIMYSLAKRFENLRCLDLRNDISITAKLNLVGLPIYHRYRDLVLRYAIDYNLFFMKDSIYVAVKDLSFVIIHV